MSACPRCGYAGPNLDAESCGRCGVVFARAHAAVTEPGSPAGPSPLAPEAQAVVPPDPASLSRGLLQPASEAPTENRWALPLAFGVALLLNATGFGRLLIYASASNWAHELGHASWRWLNGRGAVPVLFFTFYSEPGRSVGATLFVGVGLATLFLWARGEDCRALMGLAIGFFVIFLLFALALPARREHTLESFAGLFGEFWISTLWIVLFYHRLPSAVRWPQLRWAFLLLGACAYVRIFGIFVASRHDLSLLPWGSFFGGDGDLEQLLAAGWLVPFIRGVYFATAASCAVVIAGHYLYFAGALDRDSAARPHG